MTIVKQPYFLTNPEWYVYLGKGQGYILTEEAPDKAIESYNEYYRIIGDRNVKNYNRND